MASHTVDATETLKSVCEGRSEAEKCPDLSRSKEMKFQGRILTEQPCHFPTSVRSFSAPQNSILFIWTLESPLSISSPLFTVFFPWSLTSISPTSSSPPEMLRWLHSLLKECGSVDPVSSHWSPLFTSGQKFIISWPLYFVTDFVILH